MLVGNMDHEGAIVLGGANAVLSWGETLWSRLGLAARAAKPVIDLLKNSDSPAAEGLRWFLKFIEDGVFNCPAGDAAAARAAHGVPVWRYRFMGQWSNTFLGGEGAYHVNDVPLVMGTTERKDGAAKNSPEEDELIQNVMTAWATFAKDPDDGLTKLGWPKYDPAGETLIRLGYQNSGKMSLAPALAYDENCKAMKHVQPADLKPLIRFPKAG